jgi:ribosomal protein S18 acetylase RimI-like enzyme
MTSRNGYNEVTFAEHDSRRFGLRVVRGSAPEPRAVPDLMAGCRRAGAELAFATCPADRPDAVAALTAEGWYLTDIQVTFEGPTVPGPSIAPLRRRVAGAADSEAVETLARRAFASHLCHYALDPRLDAALVPLIYADWAARLCRAPDEGDVVLLYEEDRLVHFSACRFHGSERGELLLAGMDPAFRGRRIGPTVTADSIGYLHHHGAVTVTAVTGAANISSQRQLLRCGLRPVLATCMLHRWFSAAPELAAMTELNSAEGSA